MVLADSAMGVVTMNIREDERGEARFQWLHARCAELRPKTEAKWDSALLQVGPQYGFVVGGERSRHVITLRIASRSRRTVR
jgi:hypothetical protein